MTTEPTNAEVKSAAERLLSWAKIQKANYSDESGWEWHPYIGNITDMERNDVELLALHVLRQGWEPIETAPKDGREIFLSLNYQCGGKQGSHTCTGYWTNHNDGGWVTDKQGKPTHWQPLPGPPALGIGPGNRKEGE